jgi:hypothetical protein
MASSETGMAPSEAGMAEFEAGMAEFDTGMGVRLLGTRLALPVLPVQAAKPTRAAPRPRVARKRRMNNPPVIVVTNHSQDTAPVVQRLYPKTG